MIGPQKLKEGFVSLVGWTVVAELESIGSFEAMLEKGFGFAYTGGECFTLGQARCDC